MSPVGWLVPCSPVLGAAVGAGPVTVGQLGGALNTSLMFAEALQRRGQVQAVDGQAVHDVPLDDQPAQGLQGRHWGQHKQGAELAVGWVPQLPKGTQRWQLLCHRSSRVLPRA